MDQKSEGMNICTFAFVTIKLQSYSYNTRVAYLKQNIVCAMKYMCMHTHNCTQKHTKMPVHVWDTHKHKASYLFTYA